MHEMAFQEKSAWIMAVALLVGAVLYFGVVGVMSSSMGRLAPPVVPVVAVYSAILAIVAIVGHAVVAALAPKEANARLDERERAVHARAGQRSGVVFGFGVVASLGVYLWSYDGNLLFYCVFASLMLSQLVEYALQIVMYRTSVTGV
jgi:uncharacterized membrane protein (DUF485 family)